MDDLAPTPTAPATPRDAAAATSAAEQEAAEPEEVADEPLVPVPGRHVEGGLTWERQKHININFLKIFRFFF